MEIKIDKTMNKSMKLFQKLCIPNYALYKIIHFYD